MVTTRNTSKMLAAVLMLGLMFSLLAPDADARRRKDDDGAAEQAKIEEEIRKQLEPVNQELETLIKKMQGRSLFSPEDAGTLAEVKYTLLDLIYKHPKNPQLVKPIYQAGVLYSDREELNDSYELLHYLVEAFPEHPYGNKAKSKLDQLRQRYGEKYFPSPPDPKPEPAPQKAASKS